MIRINVGFPNPKQLGQNGQGLVDNQRDQVRLREGLSLPVELGDVGHGADG
jgi:hypothetical protein